MKNKVLEVFFIVCITAIICVILHFAVQNFKSTEPENDIVSSDQMQNADRINEENYRLIRQLKNVPESIHSFDEEISIVKSDAISAEEINNYLVVHNGTIKSEISRADVLDMGQIWTLEDLKKIDVIVFAISHSKSAKYISTSGNGQTVTIRSEAIDLYYYNTRTQTFFKKGGMAAKKLPEKKSGSGSYTYSLSDISQRIRKDLGLFVFPTWLMVVVLIAVIFGAFVAIKLSKERRYLRRS